MGLLDTIGDTVYAAFKGRLRSGTLRREVLSDDVDEYGDPSSVTIVTYQLEGFTDSYSAYFRSVAGIPETDVKVSIFGKSISVSPSKDDKVLMNGTWYQLRTVSTDPALALYECQAFEIDEP